jgi:hypothetical protein
MKEFTEILWLENDSKWLFKYAPFNLNSIKILLNNELWFGKPDILNDPNEAEFILTYDDKEYNYNDFKIIIKDNLEQLIVNTDSGKKNPTGFERGEFEEELKKVVRDYLGICSMSTVCNDILMWAHYADSNEGICIVFEKEILTSSIYSDSNKVTYSPAITKANFKNEGKLGHLFSEREFYMDKLVNWKNESEYRFIRRYNDRIPQDIMYKDRLEPFNKDALVGVIVGEKFKHEDFRTLVNISLLRNPNKPFYFWKSAKNLHKKIMDILPISDKNIDIYFPYKGFELHHILKETKQSNR